jgi:hypothetical protein
MALKAAIKKQQAEVEWFTQQVTKIRRAKKHDADTKAKLAAAYAGGLKTAKAELARLQAEKCRLDSLQGLNEMFRK